MLYEMIASRVCHDGLDVEARPVGGRQASDAADVAAGCARDLEAICLKAIAHGTTDRYRTAIDLADDLRRFLMVA